MANYVINELKIEADPAERDRILEYIKDDSLGKGSIDFNKLVPMPESLDVEDGSKSTKALEIHDAMAANGIIYHGERHFEFLDIEKMAMEPYEFLEKYSKEIIKDPGLIEFGNTLASNIQKYGAPTWYKWRAQNWGSKWNANQIEGYPYEEGSDILTFETAWSAVPNIIKKIAELSPGSVFIYKYADEDLGQNLGELTYKHGKLAFSHYPNPGSSDAFEFAADLWGIPISGDCAEYALSADGSRYIYTEDEQYEVVNLFGNPALYSTFLFKEDEYPAGLRRYILRGDGEKIGVLAKEEHMDGCAFRGSVLMKEDLRLDELKIRTFSEPGFPNAVREGVTFRDFLSDDFSIDTNRTEQEESEGGMDLT